MTINGHKKQGLYLQHACLPCYQHTKDRDVNAAAAYKNTNIFYKFQCIGKLFVYSDVSVIADIMIMFADLEQSICIFFL